MTERSGLAGNAALADAISATVRAEGASTPAVRGADWRQGIVTAVGIDGTVTVDDVLVCRRIEHYQAPAVGDRIVITQSSNGSWLSWGRLAAAVDTAWVTASLASGYSHDGNGNGTFRWRRLYRGGARYLELRGGVNVPGSVGTGSSVVFTLPSDWRPSSRASVPVAKNGEAHKIDINTTGTVALVSGPATAWTWAACFAVVPLD